jgi:hypothetical protein
VSDPGVLVLEEQGEVLVRRTLGRVDVDLPTRPGRGILARERIPVRGALGPDDDGAAEADPGLRATSPQSHRSAESCSNAAATGGCPARRPDVASPAPADSGAPRTVEAQWGG